MQYDAMRATVARADIGRRFFGNDAMRVTVARDGSHPNDAMRVTVTRVGIVENDAMGGRLAPDGISFYETTRSVWR